MKLRGLLTAAAVVVSIAVTSPASAQSSTYAAGLGGVTFGTVGSTAVGARLGVPVGGGGTFVIFEIGRMMNVMPQDVADTVELLEDLAELETGEDVSLEVSVPATYGFAGLRWSPVTAGSGRRIAPFVEGGFGFGRISLNIDEAEVGGIDVSPIIRDELGDQTSDTEALLALGGGVRVPFHPRASVDIGYRYSRIFTDDPTINSSMVYGAINYAFGE